MFLETDSPMHRNALLETGVSNDAAACTPADCSGKGICHRGRCFCEPGFEGKGCDKQVKCARDCSGQGECANGKCICNPGFQGVDCSEPTPCPAECNNRGTCEWGRCFCDVGYGGNACEIETGNSECPSQCNQNGICEAGVCFCKAQYTGIDCGEPVDLVKASSATAAMKSRSHGAWSVSVLSTALLATIAFVFGVLAILVVQFFRRRIQQHASANARQHAPSLGERQPSTLGTPLVISHVGSLGVLQD